MHNFYKERALLNVAAKNLNEACVSNLECNYGNPNVQCVNSFCNCSHPFELTAARLCLLPSNQGGDMFTMALTVMLALALLLLVAGYAYQKMVRKRNGSSSSGSMSSSRHSRRKLKRNTDAMTTSSTTCILTKDRLSSYITNEYSAGDDSSEAQESSLRQSRGPYGGSYMRDSSMPPRHPPRFIRQQAAKGDKSPRLSTVQEAGSSSSESEPQEELRRSYSSVSDKTEEDPRATPWRRTRKGQLLPSQDWRKTGGALVYNKPGSSSPPMHMLEPKDEHMKRVLDKQQVVVTIETHKPRYLGTSPSPPPVVSLLRRELPPSESTDDSFMKDLKRRRSLKPQFSDDLCGTMPKRCSVSAEPLRVATVAAQCDAAQDTSAEADPRMVATVSKEAPKEAEPQATGVTSGTNVPVHGFTASTKPLKKQTRDTEHGEQALPKAIEVAIDKALQLGRECGVAKTQPQISRYSTKPDKISLNTGSTNTERRSSSPPVLTSSVTEDRTRQNKALLVAEAKKTETSATGQSRDAVAPSTTCANIDAKGRECQVQPADGKTASLEVLKIVKPHADDRVDRRPTPTVFIDSNADVGSVEIFGPKAPSQNVRQGGLLVNAGVTGKMQREQLGIEAVGELACLLSRLIKTNDKRERTSSVEDSGTVSVHGPVKRKRKYAKHSGTINSKLKTDSVTTGRTEELSEHTSQQLPHMAACKLSKISTRNHDLPVKPDVSGAALKQEQTAAKLKTLGVEVLAINAAEPESSELSVAESSKKLDNKKRKTTAEAHESPLNKTFESTIRKMKSQEKTPAEQSSLESTTRESSSTDNAKGSRYRIGGRIPEPILAGVPQDYRGWVDIGAAYAAQRPPKVGESLGLSSEMVGPQDISLTFSEAGGIRSVRRKKASVSSTASETTPSISAQRPFQEYITKQLQPPVHFAERPFVEVLASMESEMASTFKDDQTTGDQGTERDLDKSSPTSAPQSSSRSAINDENLDNAVIETSSKGASGAGSGVTATIGDKAVSSSSEVSSSVMSEGKTASKVAKTTASIDSDNSSKEIARARLTVSDSDEGSFPPSGSMSLSFVSSNSSCNAAHRLTDLADLPRLEHSVAASSHETGDCSLELRMPLPRLTSSSAVQTQSSWPPASSLTECGTQAQLLPEPVPARHSGCPQVRKTRRREIGPLVATDRPWTDDVKRVVMLGNKHYLRQHAGRRPTARSATTFDETQCVLFKSMTDRSPVQQLLRWPLKLS
nr:serine-rich adhesin for platelets-like [Rhipicephalus microplus]